MSSDADASIKKSGIKSDQNGDAYIPSSTRADGSVRKQIRVRPGYQPPEDVEVYKNRTAAAFRGRGKGGPPGAEFVEPKKPNPPKKSPAKQKPEAAKSEEKIETKKEPEPAPEPEDPEVTKQKEARKLAKKLRQAKDLQQKKEDGSGLLPEQLEKVIKINELTRQLDKLGFDQEGQKKPER